MRTFLTILILCLYLTSMNFYALAFEQGVTPLRYLRIWYNYSTVLALIFLFTDCHFGFKTWIHNQFNSILWLSVILNFAINILTLHLIITDFVPKLLFFNGSVLVVTIMVLLSGIKHGLFKK